MSNGVFDEVKEIVATGLVPQRVSNRLLAALVIESHGLGKRNAADIRKLQMSDSRWRVLALGFASAAAFFGFRY